MFPGKVAYFETQLVGMAKAAAALGQIKLSVRWANWEAVTQFRQLRQVFEQGRLPIALCAADNLALAPAMRLRRNLGSRSIQPLVTFTNALGDQRDGAYEGVDAFVGRDEEESGERLIQLLEAHMPAQQHRRVLLLEGSPGTTPQRRRTTGFLRALQQRTRWELVARIATPGWRLSTLEGLIRTREFGEVDAVAAHWAGAATLAARIWAGSGRRRPIVVGLEYDPAIRQAMIDGFVHGTVLLDIEAEGEKVITTVVDLVNNRRAKHLFVPTQQYNLLPSDPRLAR